MIVNSAKALFGELGQDYRQVKERLDISIREFDQALWDQAREVILGTLSLDHSLPYLM